MTRYVKNDEKKRTRKGNHGKNNTEGKRSLTSEFNSGSQQFTGKQKVSKNKTDIKSMAIDAGKQECEMVNSLVRDQLALRDAEIRWLG
jgi:hypothetical protein